MFPEFHLRTLTSVPSMSLSVKSRDGKLFIITLDSGATVSFMSKKLCVELGLDIRPNGQLATLADPKFRVKSVGEVDCVVTECTSATAMLRLRALVLEELAVDCYGGTTLHLDNHLVPDLTTSTVWAHGFRFAFRVPPHNQQALPPPSISTDPFVCSTPSSSMPPTAAPLQIDTTTPPTSSPNKSSPTPSPQETLKPTGEPILMTAAKTLLPEGYYNLPLQGTSLASSVLVLPPTPLILDRTESAEGAGSKRTCFGLRGIEGRSVCSAIGITLKWVFLECERGLVVRLM